MEENITGKRENHSMRQQLVTVSDEKMAPMVNE